MNLEWEVPFLLTSPRGTLKFNQVEDVTGGIFKLDPQKCEAKTAIRATTDNVPQRDGSLRHRRYREGTELVLGGWIMQDIDHIACDALLREMWDVLGLHLNPLQTSLTTDEADVLHRRIQWTPSGYGQDRLLPDVRLNQDPTATFDGSPPWQFSFSLHSPFPYCVDITETTTHISSGSPTLITNPGNCPVWPNFKVYGPTSGFIYNSAAYTGFQISYDASQPGAEAIGGGDYAFFGHFANNVFLNGSGDNLIAGVNIATSTFFPLMPGDNFIGISGASMDVIWNAGWRT